MQVGGIQIAVEFRVSESNHRRGLELFSDDRPCAICESDLHEQEAKRSPNENRTAALILTFFSPMLCATISHFSFGLCGIPQFSAASADNQSCLTSQRSQKQPKMYSRPEAPLSEKDSLSRIESCTCSRTDDVVCRGTGPEKSGAWPNG